MNSQFKRGIIELCVLSELVGQDMYGYMVINNISCHLDVNENTIYPILRRLTIDGYFSTYLEESNQGAPRKYYRITDLGFKYYMELRNEWDRFIGGVYEILNQGGKKNEEILRKFEERIAKTKN
ncbi:MAG: PadR family transcriptional regulator [Candidatus Izemoplasmatales bacterium]|jgi:PadR family transcriptional regulator PadR|nr:PadR family transcriptional regulator [Candidatus Izemoplasmatales bacterium]